MEGGESGKGWPIAKKLHKRKKMVEETFFSLLPSACSFVETDKVFVSQLSLDDMEGANKKTKTLEMKQERLGTSTHMGLRCI